MLKGLALCLVLAAPVAAQQTEPVQMDHVMVVSLLTDGKVIRSGVGFLYDERTLICSYSDIKDASQIRVQSDIASASTNRLIALNEDLDIAALHIAEEFPAETPLGNSNTLAIGDPISFWTEANGKWTLGSGNVRSIADTGKGYDVISVNSATTPKRSSPLYNSRKQIVGWLKGTRAVPLGLIARLAEKPNENVTILEAKASELKWKFKKPDIAGTTAPPQVTELVTMHGPASFPFRIDLPHAWKSRAYEPSRNFLLRMEDPKSGVCAELRATHSSERDLLAGIDRTETLVFTGLLRSQLIPYSTNHFSGFRAQYEDADSRNPYSLDVFYTAFSGNLYILSLSYPQNYQNELSDLTEQIFSSFRQ